MNVEEKLLKDAKKTCEIILNLAKTADISPSVFELAICIVIRVIYQTTKEKQRFINTINVAMSDEHPTPTIH